MILNNVQDFFKLGMARDMPSLFPTEVGGLKLNVGAGNKFINGTMPLDYPQWDADRDKIPFDNNCINEIFAFHFLEHCKDPVAVLQEFQRVLTVGGVVHIIVPYYSAMLQAQDLDHKHSFCEETWKTLFANKFYNKNQVEWQFEIGINTIIGICERNLCLMTELRKTG